MHKPGHLQTAAMRQSTAQGGIEMLNHLKLYSVTINNHGAVYARIIAAAVDKAQAKAVGEHWAFERGLTKPHFHVLVSYSHSLNQKPVYTFHS
jgi:hypothetical protein